MIPMAFDASVAGLVDAHDTWHKAATAPLESIRPDAFSPVYFDCCMTEAVSAVARRFHEKQRIPEFHQLIEELSTRVSPAMITWILPDVPRLYTDILEFTRSWSGELNFNDSLIALACRERSIDAIASFDHDFDRVVWVRRASSPSEVQALLAA